MLKKIRKLLKPAKMPAFLAECLAYGAFISGYYFLVLHFLSAPLKQLSDNHKGAYAFVALLLVITQGALLEILTTALFKLFRRKIR